MNSANGIPDNPAGSTSAIDPPDISETGERARAEKNGLEEKAEKILAGALRRADVADPQELARTIAPMVVAALRREIADAGDEAPSRRSGAFAGNPALAAQLFVARVGARLAARLGALLSMRSWRMRLQSLRTGRPLREILLEQEQRPRLRSIFALERDSSRLIAKWRSDGLATESTSTLTAAIKQFSLKEFASAHGEPRVMNFRTSRILLHASQRLIVTAEFSGEPHPDDKARMSKAINALIRKDAPDDRDLARIAADFSPTTPTAAGVGRKARLGWLLGAAAVFAGFAIFTLSPRNQPSEGRLRETLAAQQGAQPRLVGWPLTLSLDRSRHVAVLSGVAPPGADLDALTWSLAKASAPYPLELHVTPVETTASAAQAETRQSERATVLAHRLDGLEARVGAAEKWLAARQAEADAPAARLATLAEKTVILFGDDDTFLDSEIAHRQLAALAAELKASGGSLRVVGYTDSHGSLIKNRALSKGRADAVINVLLAEGVSAQKLVAAGRADQAPIAIENGADRRRNRRVTFEVLDAAGRGQ